MMDTLRWGSRHSVCAPAHDKARTEPADKHGKLSKRASGLAPLPRWEPPPKRPSAGQAGSRPPGTGPGIPSGCRLVGEEQPGVDHGVGVQRDTADTAFE